MQHKISLSIVTIVLGLSSFLVYAEDTRLERQNKRITHGATSGQLTTQEQTNLSKRIDHMEAVETKVNADGNVTKKEKAYMAGMNHKNSQAIFRQKHNHQKMSK